MGKTETPAKLTGKAKEDYDKRVAAQSKPTEKKRTVLTDAERIAKLEADLAAARKKAEAKRNKARDAALEKRAKLVAKRDELNAQIARIDAEFPATETGGSSAEIGERKLTEAKAG